MKFSLTVYLELQKLAIILYSRSLDLFFHLLTVQENNKTVI